ncbi:hypothetical protein MUP32_07105, partial [Candidatus Microgenomates bacterium]|nr:hypothetical protein [Candidatus Microgenomates bacterium]
IIDLHKKKLVSKVVLGGNEIDDLSRFEKLVTKLTEAKIEVIVQAGQIMKYGRSEEEARDLGHKNIQTAVGWAMKEDQDHPLISLACLQVDKIGDDGVDLMAVAQKHQIITMPMSDLEVGDLAVPLNQITDDISYKLAKLGVPIRIGDSHASLSASSVVMGAVAIADKLVAPIPGIYDEMDKIPDPKKKINHYIEKYAELYQAEATKYLQFRPVGTGAEHIPISI